MRTALRIVLLLLCSRRVLGIAVLPTRAGLRAASAPLLTRAELALELEGCDAEATWAELLAREPACADGGELRERRGGAAAPRGAEEYALAGAFARAYVGVVALLLLSLEHLSAARMLAS